MKVLVGTTGFVGGNLYSKGDFDSGYCSKDVSDAYGLCPDLLVYAGVPAEKYMANSVPEQDVKTIEDAFLNIRKINPVKLVLISTIDVFCNPRGVDENSEVDETALQPYGKHRHMLEKMVRDHYPDALIIRLPGLYGKGIKKNFIYDYIHPVPKRLGEKKLRELTEKNPRIANYYEYDSASFYRLSVNNKTQEKEIKQELLSTGFSSLQFTDSRSVYQFYDLACLWDDMNKALDYDLRTLHLATEPIAVSEIYEYLTGKEFKNEFLESPPVYDFRTIYDSVYDGSGGYIKHKCDVLETIQKFVMSEGIG